MERLQAYRIVETFVTGDDFSGCDLNHQRDHEDVAPSLTLTESESRNDASGID
jgi:hypothetical protein